MRQTREEILAAWDGLPEYVRARLQELIRRDLPASDGELVEVDVAPFDEPAAAEDTMVVVELSSGHCYAATYVTCIPEVLH